MTEIRVPVLIVGGGPVGVSLAMELGWRNIPSLLVNERPSTSTHPKGSTINSRSLEHMRRMGCAAKIRAAGLPADHPTDSCYVTRLAEWELGRIKMPSSREKIQNPGPWGATEFTPEPIHRCNQFYFEAIMRAHAEEFKHTDMRYSWRLLSFEDVGDHVHAEVEEIGSGRTERIIADYLVGCDGGQGMVRRQLGFTYGGRSSTGDRFYDGTMLSIYIRAREIFEVINMPIAWHYWTINPKGRVDFITLDGEGEYVLLAEIPPGVPLGDIDVDDIVQNAIGADTRFDIVSVQEWMAGLALVTDHYQRNRVILAGDSTHLFTPSGGFGFNTGIDDTANLGWKLGAVIEGWARPELLDTYEIERRPIGIRNTSASGDYADKIGSLKFADWVDEDSERGVTARRELEAELLTFKEEFASLGVILGARYDGSPLIIPDGTIPPPDHRAQYTPSACPGGRAPHYWIGEKVSLYDQLGPWFSLLQLGPDAPEVNEWKVAAGSLGIPLRIVRVEEPGIRDVYEAPLALIRPDQHVAWRGEEGRAIAILKAATGWLY